MIQNNNNIQLNEMEESSIKTINEVIAKDIGEDHFTISIEFREEVLEEIYLLLDIPVRPADGEKISKLYVSMKANGGFYLEYLKRTECISNERGCIAANEINSNMVRLPVKSIYSENEEGFYISSVFYNPKDIIEAINTVLLVLEYLIILESFLKGTATDVEIEQAFDAIVAGGDHISHKIEDFNIC